MMMHSIKTLLCLLAFVSLSRAETWEDTVTIGMWNTAEFYVSFIDNDQSITQCTTYSNCDINRYYTCLASTADESCFYYLEMYGKSQNGSIWTVKDTATLNFAATFDLFDTSIFTAHGTSVELDSGIYGFEQYFIFLLGSGKYAFCHGAIIDTTIFWTYLGILRSGSVHQKMPLACQVQEDGTPTFDSIPQYKEPPVALPSLRQSTIQKQSTPSAPYRVNGTSASPSTAIGIRVGKDTAIRDQ